MSDASLTPIHRRYIRNETLVGCVFNGVLSVVFAFIVFQGVASIPLWGPQGMAVDLIPTVFMITLVGNLIVTVLTRKRLAAGQVPALAPASKLGLPRNALLRMLLLAVLFTAVLVPLSILALWALRIDALPFWPFVGFKVVYGAAVGALSAGIVVRAALRDGDRAAQAVPAPQA